MELQKTLSSQNHPKWKEESQRYHASGFQTLLKNYGNKNSMVLGQK